MADVHAMAMQTRSELFDELQQLSDDDFGVMTCCEPTHSKGQASRP